MQSNDSGDTIPAARPPWLYSSTPNSSPTDRNLAPARTDAQSAALADALHKLADLLEAQNEALAAAILNTTQARDKCHEMANYFHALATAVDCNADAAKYIAEAAEDLKLHDRIESAQSHLRYTLDGISKRR